MSNIKKIFFNSMLVFIVLGNFEYAHSAEQAAKSVVKKAAESISNVLGSEALGEAMPYVGIAVNVYGLAQDAKSHFYPNDEEKAKAEAIEEAIQRITLIRELRECLIKHRRDFHRGPHGIPCACEKTAEMLAAYGGSSDANTITEIFRIFNK